MCRSSLGSFEVRLRSACIVLLSAVALASPDAQAGEGAKAIRSDVLAWMLQNNKGLGADFLKTEPPNKTVLLPDGRSVSILHIKQFLDVNFRLTFSARKKEGINLVETQEWQLRKLMAHPEFYNWIKSHAHTYKISGKGWVSSLEAYNYLRNIKRNINVTVSSKVHAPVGGGNGINAPSWAVWKQMNLFWHEACHCIGIGHNSGGLSGPLAGELREWDRRRWWNYETIDINTLQVPKDINKP
jgi:hypothetical protein